MKQSIDITYDRNLFPKIDDEMVSALETLGKDITIPDEILSLLNRYDIVELDVITPLTEYGEQLIKKINELNDVEVLIYLGKTIYKSSDGYIIEHRFQFVSDYGWEHIKL